MLTFLGWQKVITLALMVEGCMRIVAGNKVEPDPPLLLSGDTLEEVRKKHNKEEALFCRESTSRHVNI